MIYLLFENEDYDTKTRKNNLKFKKKRSCRYYIKKSSAFSKILK